MRAYGRATPAPEASASKVAIHARAVRPNVTAEGHPQVAVDNDGLRARTFDQASGQSGIVCQQRSNADQDGIMMERSRCVTIMESRH